VNPPRATLPADGAQAFFALPPTVIWSIREANGGTISASGLYRAPTTAGNFTVVALEPTSGVSGEAAVTVMSAGTPITHGLAIPPTHPRLWFDGPRLARARTWYQTHVFTPSTSDYIARATRGLLGNDSAQCRAAIDWALAQSQGMPMSAVSCDNCRWYGEQIILTYDWCHAFMTPGERSTFIGATNTWINHWRQQNWGGPDMPENNYHWGYTRNELLWAITSPPGSRTTSTRRWARTAR
jgi:hypothetical protein